MFKHNGKEAFPEPDTNHYERRSDGIKLAVIKAALKARDIRRGYAWTVQDSIESIFNTKRRRGRPTNAQR